MVTLQTRNPHAIIKQNFVQILFKESVLFISKFSEFCLIDEIKFDNLLVSMAAGFTTGRSEKKVITDNIKVFILDQRSN